MNEQLLREANLIRGHLDGIKILGDGELKHGLTIEVDKISASAREKIEKAGGSATIARPAAAQGRIACQQRAKPVAQKRARSPAKAERLREKEVAKKKAPSQSARLKKKPRVTFALAFSRLITNS